MAPDPTDFRRCYYHPRRPATRECINCERPICGRCEEVSGDPLLCAKCKEELEALDKTPFDRMLRQGNVATSRRQAGSVAGEVTITPDGKIDAPEPPAPAPVEKEKPQAAEPVDAEPARAVRGERRRVPGFPGARRPAAQEPSPVPAARLREADAETSDLEFDEDSDELEFETSRERAAARKTTRRKRPPRDTTGPFYQTLHGLTYAIGGALLACAVWLLFAFVFKQWSQVSILTIGLLVPWVFYKGTTTRNRAGVKVWSEPPAPAWISVPSLIIVAAVAPVLQLLAFKIIYGANVHRLPFSDFMERFFTSLNWPLAILGLLAAVLVPFVLTRGAAWRKPELRRSRQTDEEEVEGERQTEVENS